LRFWDFGQWVLRFCVELRAGHSHCCPCRASSQQTERNKRGEAAIAQGGTVEQACRQLGISDATYYNWRKQYGQMKLDQVKQLKASQRQNSQLKKLVADLSLDNAILKEALSGNY
jgi:putative transposase